MAWRPPSDKPLQGSLPVHTTRPRPDKRRYMRASYRRMRIAKLTENPWCVIPGCNELATQLDHIVPIAEGGTDDWDNLQGMCRRHHGVKTRFEELRRAGRIVGKQDV